LARTKDKNCITGKPLSGKKVGAFSQKLDLQVVKQVCKHIGCTNNELHTALLSTTCHEYFKRNGESHNKINAVSPFSLRQPIKDLKDFRLDNDIVGMIYDLKMHSDFDLSLKE